jgi:sugar transferase (PEP-CTERM/EpsH1 system associated)
MSAEDPRPLVVHLVYRFATGGMENGVVNLLNRLPPERYRHAIVSLTDASDFRLRLKRLSEIEFVELRQPKGNDFGTHRRLYRELRRLKPAILHTRNLAAQEGQISGLLARVPVRIHGEHGRDMYDLHGKAWKYNLLRKAIRPIVHRYVAVSRDLAEWLVQTVGVERARVRQIYNGVDTDVFAPKTGPRPPILPEGFAPNGAVVFGTVGRMAEVKDQTTLARAFVRMVRERPELRATARLALIGDGPLRESCRAILAEASCLNLAWLPGERKDIGDVLRAFDVFVLPSLGEGISNTILEAMSTALRASAGEAGRKDVLARFSLDAMVSAYADVYDSALAEKGIPQACR